MENNKDNPCYFLENPEEESHIKMDFSLKTVEERKQKVDEILKATPPEKLTSQYLEKLADYLILAAEPNNKKEKRILTENRLVTVNKWETSYEGLVGKFENGEDGLYGIVAQEQDKNIIISPKAPITEKDLEEIPTLKELKNAIAIVEDQAKKAQGKTAFLLKKQVIEMRKDQYVLKGMFKKPIYCMNLVKSISKFNLDEKVYIDKNGEIKSTGLINLYNPTHISLLLCNYSKLKEDSWSNFYGDVKWLLYDLEEIIDGALKEKYPMYYDLLIYKIDGKTNLEIQSLLFKKYNKKHTTVYISSLWRNKIPKLIAEEAQKEWIIWHYTMEEKGQWKKCSRCGQIKVADNRFFSKNSASRDGFYSICKDCRNKKTKERR